MSDIEIYRHSEVSGVGRGSAQWESLVTLVLHSLGLTGGVNIVMVKP